ncbi:hypothetical protein SLA2020_061550 [Shorea laevis]
MAALQNPQVVVLDVDPREQENQEGKQRSSSSSDESGIEIKQRGSSVSESSVEVDLGSGVQETIVNLEEIERDCRICHLSLDATNQESGVPIELGCSCKDDLAAAHKHCAEAWFKIKGNKTCEICGSIARNIAYTNEGDLTEQRNEANDSTISAQAAAMVLPTETRSFWHANRFLNFLLACMVLAFVISWLFHFNVPS